MHRDTTAQSLPSSRFRVDRELLEQDERVPLLGFYMSLADAEQVRGWLLAERGSPSVVRLRELIWLRAVLVEQWRRTPVAERHRFARRADSILEQLGRCAPASPSDGMITVGHHEKP